MDNDFPTIPIPIYQYTTSYAREIMYQALPTFPYCKQDKAEQAWKRGCGKHIYEAKCLQI